MPTYDYRCEACGHEMEAFQSMTAKPFKKCPECKKLKLVRLIGTGAAVLFKGSGFWQTDYRSESYKSDAAKDKPADTSKSDKKSDAKAGDKKTTETKPAAKKSDGGSSSSNGKGGKAEGAK
ncbi:MAG: zinc ribbon domain-containing protein [Phycisphaeraceae bacterium]